MIHATLDDVGACETEGMCAVVGYVAAKPQWESFNWAWKQNLKDIGIPFLHTSEYLYRYPRVGSGGLTDDDVFNTLRPFIDIVHRYLINPEFGFSVCIITECDAYERLTVDERKYVREPALNSFELAIGLAYKQVHHTMSAENTMAVQMGPSAKDRSRSRWAECCIVRTC